MKEKDHDSYDYWCPSSPEENEEEIGRAEEIPQGMIQMKNDQCDGSARKHTYNRSLLT